MKSCRNCENAIQDGYYWVQLICRLNRQVIVPFSKSLDENKASDMRASKIANVCPEYTGEENAN